MSLIDDPSDKRKYEALYKEYWKMMYCVAYGILKNNEDAEDVVQKAFIRVMYHLKDIDENDRQKTKAYLMKIAQNLSYDTCRRRKRDWTQTISFDAYEMFLEDPNGQAFEDINDGSEGKRLAEAIKQLPPKFEEVIRLTYGHGYSSDKVGEILNISSDNVRQRLVRARKRLAELLGGKKDKKGKNGAGI